MLTFLIVCFILFFVLPRVAFWLFRVWYRRKVRQTFEQAQKQYGQTHAQYGEKEPTRPPRRRKRIDPEVGEYVEFEEISNTVRNDADEVTVTETEAKIEDATWEDLPK